MKNLSNILIRVIVVSTLLGSVISCQSSTDNVIEISMNETTSIVTLTSEQYQKADIEIGNASQRIIGSELRVNGLIDVPPQSNISIHMPYGGFIKYTNMLPGTLVKKGQFLVAIENPEFIQFQQKYLECIANQEYLKMEFERQHTLFQEQVASGKSYQQAKSNYLANEAKLKSMEANLRLIGFNPSQVREGKVSAVVNIYSPVTGSIREIFVNVGRYINPQDVIMNITNSEDLHVELSVYEDDIGKVRKGQRIRFNYADQSNVWREAEVFLVGTGVREDRSVTVHGHLKNKLDDLIPGMYVMAKIETGSIKAWTLPETAVTRFAGKHYIFGNKPVQANGTDSTYQFQMIEVEKGITEDEFVEIKLIDKTLDIATMDVVVKGAFILLAKSKNKEEVE